MQALSAIAFLSAAATVGAQCQAPISWPLPWSWPTQHTHQEIEWGAADGVYQNKMVNYNFDNLQLRYDMNYLSGPKKIGTVLNFTSLWLNDTLYMFTWETVLSKTPSCVALSMGFGMMIPGWFLGGNQSGLVWNARKSDSFDTGYHRTVLSETDAGQGGAQDDEVFTYYYTLENSTDPGLTNGSPFLMHAPSPAGMVVNEYYNFQPHTYGPADPVFALPSSPACIPTEGVAANAKEAWAMLKAAGLENPPFTEVMLGALNPAAHRQLQGQQQHQPAASEGKKSY